jgi:acetylornithine deacetylase
MNEGRFIDLLGKLIGESEHLQNNPSQGLVPREDLASNHILELLAPYNKENGGVLEIEKLSYVEGRGNLIIKYPGTTDKVCSFVGSHLDVVPADPTGWKRNPFQLIQEGDLLYGRGTTDCLGHVAMLTDMLATLAENKPALETTVVVIFIANEENSSFHGVGVDQIAKEGHMESLKSGPVFWIDSADSQPCMGTCGMLQWKLEVTGKLFHSGLPHKGINSIEFGNDVINEIQRRFYQDFPRTEMEDKYNFVTCSTFKPTQITCAKGSINQLPPNCTIEGDCRLCPFYDVKDVRMKVDSYIKDINANPSALEGKHGPHSKYQLEDGSSSANAKLTWSFLGENGVACDIDSKGFGALREATMAVLGEVKPYSIGGSLPLIRDLQDNGFDVIIAGYGFSSKYHADNEAVSLTDMKNASKIIFTVIKSLSS